MTEFHTDEVRSANNFVTIKSLIFSIINERPFPPIEAHLFLSGNYWYYLLISKLARASF